MKAGLKARLYVSTNPVSFVRSTNPVSFVRSTNHVSFVEADL